MSPSLIVGATPTLLLIGSVLVVLLFLIGGGIFVLRQLSAMQSTMKQVQTTSKETQEASRQAQEVAHQAQASTANYLQQIQVAQASTQTAVTTAQQETLRSVQHLQQFQQDSKLIMNDIKTQQGTAQTIFTDWQQGSQVLFAEWHKDTVSLRQALQTTYQQGTWGEQELERVIYLSGMQRHCDFDAPFRLPNGKKPDMVIHLHDRWNIVVDAKAPSQSYLNAVRCEDEKARAILLKDYARRIRDMMLELGGREYWNQFPASPAVTVLFLPNEAMLRTAFECDPALFDLAAEKGVLLASPMTLIALLKAIAYGWSQQDRAQNVEHIIEASRELHNELISWLKQWQQLKKTIQKTVADFDHVTSAYQTRVLPLITKLGQFDSTWDGKEEAFNLQPIQERSLFEGVPLPVSNEEERNETGGPNEEESDDALRSDEQDDADQGAAD